MRGRMKSRLHGFLRWAAVGLILFGSMCGGAKPLPASPTPMDSQNNAGQAFTKEAKKIGMQGGTQKAVVILDQAYQLAINAKPSVKVEALTQIADTMKQVDKARAAQIYRAGFEATQEVPLDEEQFNKAEFQSRLAVGLADIDAEAAMELARRIDQPRPTEQTVFESLFGKGKTNFRALAIQKVALKLAEKDLPRAMILVLPTLRERNFPYQAILPLAAKLKASSPDQAQDLYSEIVQQFTVEDPTFLQVISFITLVRTLSNLNRNLTIQAINVVLQKIPVMEEGFSKALQEESKKTGHPVMPMPFSFGAIAKGMLLPVMKKLEPERAAALEKEILPAVQAVDNMSGGLLSSSLMSPNLDIVEGPQAQQERMLDKLDPQKLPERQRSMMSGAFATSLAASNPKKASDFVQYIDDKKQEALALAAIAGGYASLDKEKARSVLADAMTAAEKIRAKEDRAVLFTMLAESAAKIEQEQARNLYKTAFENYDQAFEELGQAVSTEKQRQTNENLGIKLSVRYSRAIAGYAKIDFDDAVERAKRIQDDHSKLMTLVDLATRVLLRDRPIPPIQFVNSVFPIP